MNALDSGLERKILDAILQRLAGRTLLVITHRLETAMSADHVICIGSGRVLDCGSPAEMRTRPASLFWKLLQDAREGEVAASAQPSIFCAKAVPEGVNGQSELRSRP